MVTSPGPGAGRSATCVHCMTSGSPNPLSVIAYMGLSPCVARRTWRKVPVGRGEPG
ncbi:Uncharacterised protein [Mycobacteroides abscessus subsp. abscessus]|nr:Uncharacterised protein [Mycobacteroides abscessus subsp. abscessus]